MLLHKETAHNLATPVKYGYIRVSSKEQTANFSLDSQKNELISFGVSEKLIFSEVASATKELEARPILNSLILTIKAGDSLVVTKLDRVSRNTLTFLTIQALLKKKSANLVILDMPQDYDANLASHELNSTLLAAVAEFESLRRVERQQQGIALAKQQNKYLGRKTDLPKNLVTNNLLAMVVIKRVAFATLSKSTTTISKSMVALGSLTSYVLSFLLTILVSSIIYVCFGQQ